MSHTKPTAHRPPIAVVGVSALFPGSTDSTGFWNDILAGTDRMTEVPTTHWLVDDHFDADQTTPDRTYGRRGGFLDPIDFDAMGFGVPPSVVPSTDTAQLLALIVAQRVLDDALRGQFSELDRNTASVILGVTSGQELFGAMASRMSRPMWLQGMRRAGIAEDVALDACDRILALHPEWTEATFPGLLGNVVAGRIANRLDLGGTNCVTDAACASSFSAISMGVNELYLGDSDLVIAGGVDTMNDIFMYMCFSKTPALSKSEDIRPFSDQADGTMLGEGLGMVALKRLDDAEADGNDIYCVIDGVGSSSDGRSKSVYAPVSSGQARALTNAYDKAGYGPDTVELVEAHGTGTVAGDAAEFGGLELAFDAGGRTDRQWCALGSVKSQIGHTKAAAGAAGLFKVVMALHHRVLPQTAKIDRPNPELDLEQSPFHLNTATRPWVRGSDHERRGAVSSFGFGGSNFHIALSEYTGPAARAPRLRSSDVEMVVLTGSDGAAVAADARRMAASLTDHRELERLTYLAQTTQASYDASANARLAVVATDDDDLGTKLVAAADALDDQSDVAFSWPTGVSFGVGSHAGDVALLFPGQGSQYVGMGAGVAMNFTAAMGAWDLAASQDWDEAALQNVVFPFNSFHGGAASADHELLTATHWAQPAIGTMSLGLLRLLRAIGVDAQHVGGHSFGEITALHAGGALTDVDLIRVARRRGELMAEAAQTPGSMTAVTGSIESVRSLVDGCDADVVIANHNSANQVVLSGPTPAIEQVERDLTEQGLRAKRLPVATAFHSSVVSGASDAFADFLADVAFDVPAVPVHANETAEPYAADEAAMRTQLARQLSRPVRFVEMIEAMYAGGARTFVEVGPSSVLTGLVGDILEGRDHRAIPLDKKNKGGLSAWYHGLGRLVAAGVEMDLGALWSEYGTADDPLDRPTPKLAIPINGANYDSPYPPHDLNELAEANPVTPMTPMTPMTPEPTLPPSAPMTPGPMTPAPPVPPAAPVAAPTSATEVSPVAPPVAVPQSPVTPAGAPLDSGVLAAYQNAQHQTAAAHTAYLNSMAQAHSAFLEAAQRGIAVLGQLAGGGTGAPDLASPAAPVPPIAAPAPAPAVAPTPAHVSAAPVSAMPAPPVTTSSNGASPAPAPTSTGVSAEEMTSLLLGVVADRTGYPSEMLSMEMELESDLGIDSIKRVEILSAMQDLVPELPEVDLAVMAGLATLGEIVDYLVAQAASAGDMSSNGASPAPAPTSSGVSLGEMTSLLLGVVADRTGYPSEMLSMEMELESDLGIDSIKRVEILSAMQDLVPELPEVDLAVMAGLATLGEIVDYLAAQTAGADTLLADADEPVPSANSAASVGEFGRFVVRTNPLPDPGVPLASLLDAPIAIVGDPDGLGAAVAAELADHGAEATVIQSIDEGSTHAIIDLGNFDRADDVDTAIGLNRRAFETAKDFAETATSGGVYVAVADSSADPADAADGAARSWASGLAALVRTAAIEWPSVQTKFIDIDRSGRDVQAIAAEIANELMQGGDDREVRIDADGQRLGTHTEQIDVTAGALPIGPDDVVVVSGGARGVTAATIIELANASRSSFVLLGRSKLSDEPSHYAAARDDASLKQLLLSEAGVSGRILTPAELSADVDAVLANREIRATLASIDRGGATASYVAVDITDRDAVTDALESVRDDLGPITALIHGAGVLADKAIVDKTVDQFDMVFDTKVTGLRNLLDATAGDDLAVLCFFSSVAARTGNAGQVDYAMANEVLNTVAAAEQARRGPDCVVKSLGWGPWAGGMVTPSLRAHFASMGVGLIDLDVGARMFVDELASTQADVHVLLGGGVLPSAESNTARAAQSVDA